MTQQTHSIRGRSRFADLFDANRCSRPAYDTVLAEIHDCIIVPSLGSIVPGWLLLIPKEWHLNFADWERGRDRTAVSIIYDYLSSRNILPQRLIWFEHGAHESNSAIGCGVEHAHMHLLIDPPFNFIEFGGRSRQALPYAAWKRIEPLKALKTDGRSYLRMGVESEAFFSNSVDQAGSQFFRKVISNLVGQPNDWDYRTAHHSQNIERTLQSLAS